MGERATVEDIKTIPIGNHLKEAFEMSYERLEQQIVSKIAWIKKDNQIIIGVSHQNHVLVLVKLKTYHKITPEKNPITFAVIKKN